MTRLSNGAPDGPGEEVAALQRVAEEMATAIARGDAAAVAARLAPGFLHRTPGGTTMDRDAFLAGVAALPGQVLFIRLQDLQIDVTGDGALMCGVQHARLQIGRRTVDDRRGFVEYFVRDDGRWLLRAAFDVTGDDPPAAPGGPHGPRVGF